MQPPGKIGHDERLASARRLLTVLAASAYDEGAGGLVGLLTLGLDWLKRQQLAALAWVKLKPAYLLPADVALDLRHAFYAAVADSRLHQQELAEVSQALLAGGLRPVTLKGAALAYTVYPDPACRPMGDLDFWLSEADLPQAQAILESAGYACAVNPGRPLAMVNRYRGEVIMVRTRPNAGLVELHWSIFLGEWLRRAARVDDSGVWSRAVPPAGDMALATLAPEDAIIHLCTHAAINHQLSLAALRSLVDVAFLARHAPLDWSVIIQRAREWRVATATWLVLSLTVDLCGLAEAADAVRQLAPSRLRQKLIGLFANAGALVNLRDLSRSKWRYVYLLLMVDRKQDAVKLIYRALWPEDEWLQARYGKSGWQTRLRHLFDAARGRI